MDYNTARAKLVLPEYGRNVQRMVEYAVSLPNREERQACAETIVGIMARMFPQQTDAEDFERMLWDHLAMISDYKLDVDWPYPVTRLDGADGEQPHLAYPEQEIKYRPYGHTLEQMVKALPDMADEEERAAATELVVAQMAKSLAQWNSTVLSPEKLAADLEELSGGRMQMNIDEPRLRAIINTAVFAVKAVPVKKKKK